MVKFFYSKSNNSKTMKKQIKVFLTLALVGSTSLIYAQDVKSSTTVTTTTTTAVDNNDTKSNDDRDYPAVYLGVRFLPTFTYLDYRQIDNSTGQATAVVGYGYGGFLGFNLSDHVGLQAEVIYSQLAQQYKIADRVNNIRIDYINIPLLLRLNTGYSKPVNLNFVIGPQFGINVGSAVDVEDNGNSTTTVQTKLAVKSGDVGIAYGAGLDFSLGGYTKLGLGFRGVYGLVDVSDNSNNVVTDDYYVLDRTHIKTYAGYIGISFGF
jgi:hypothetical protein